MGPFQARCAEDGPPSPHCSCRFLLQLQLQKSQYLQLGPSRGQYYGGSLPNVNQIGSGTVDLPFQVSNPPHPLPTLPSYGSLPWPPTWVTSTLGKFVCVMAALDSQGQHTMAAALPPHTLLLLSCPWDGLARPCPDPPWPVPCQHQQTLQQGLNLAASVSAATTPVGRLCSSGNRLGPLGLGSISLTNPQAQRFSEGGPET